MIADYIKPARYKYCTRIFVPTDGDRLSNPSLNDLNGDENSPTVGVIFFSFAYLGKICIPT